MANYKLLFIVVIIILSQQSLANSLKISFRKPNVEVSHNSMLKDIVRVKGGNKVLVNKINNVLVNQAFSNSEVIVRDDIEKLISSVATNSNIDYLWKGSDKTFVSRIYEVPSEELTNLVYEYIKEKSALMGLDAQVKVFPVSRRRLTVKEKVNEVALVKGTKCKLSKRTCFDFILKGEGFSKKIRRWYKTEIIFDAYVAKEPINKGDVLSRRYVKKKPVYFNGQCKRGFIDKKALTGVYMYKENIGVNTIVCKEYLIKNRLVNKSSEVDFVYLSNGVEILGKAISETSGDLGEVITVKFGPDKSSINAKVIGKGKVKFNEQ